MRFRFALLLTAGFLLSMASVGLCENLLQNADFKEGSQGWHGDGRAVYLKPDGTEGDEHDPGVIPVIRVTLAKRGPHSVYQEIRSKNMTGKVHVSVQVFASIDFKRSTHADDYAVSDSWSNLTMTDFEIRFMQPDWFMQRDSDLKRGEWVTIQETWSGMQPADERSLFFVVPPGDGYVYIKNPELTQ